MQPQSHIFQPSTVLLLVAVVILSGAGFGYAQGATTPAAPPQKPVASDLYAAEPVPLTPVQCGQCHTAMYRDLKTNGGRHRFLCQNCHINFHSYSPEKNNWKELMPKCGNCHSSPPHGPKFPTCSICHGNPHAVAILTSTETILNSCPDCHSKPFEQLQKFPSAHTKLLCRNCHTAHGYIPSCTDCHKPHLKGQSGTTCTTCHQAHMPLEIAFRKDADTRTCSVCHYEIYQKWSNSPSRHAKVNCGVCHTKHGYIPACGNCHHQPHSEEMLANFPTCLTCHQDAHDPPVKRRR